MIACVIVQIGCVRMLQQQRCACSINVGHANYSNNNSDEYNLNCRWYCRMITGNYFLIVVFIM